MRLSKFLMIICVFLIGTPAIAGEKIEISQEDKHNLTTTAQKLALCSGVYDMVSEIHKLIDNPALSFSTHETANGAEIAAAYLMASIGVIPDWKYALKYAENTRNSEKMRQAALFEAAGNSPEAINKAVGNLTESLEKCNVWSELQAELVQQAKLWMYANQPKS